MTGLRKFVGAAGLVLGLALGSASLAADAWTPYHNPEFKFSVELPGTPSVRANPAQTPGGEAPGVIGQLPTAAGVLMFGANDYSALPRSSDLQARLEAAVAGAISNSKQTLDSETKITVGGVPGRDITAHNDSFVSRSRLLMTPDRLFIVVGVGAPVSAGVPAEYPRFALSLKPD